MPSPFLGMNPYLEHPSLWAGIHHRLITAIANDLAPQLRPKYIVNVKRLLDEIYDQGSYDLRIDYTRPPIPAVSETDRAWVDETLKQQGFR